MNERLLHLRKKLGLSQEAFGKRLGVTKTTISRLEKGERNITEQMIKSICREFRINEDWFRTGIGTINLSPIDNKLDQLSHELNLSDTEYKFFKLYLSLDDKKREAVAEFLENIFDTDSSLASAIEKSINPISTNDSIEMEVEKYRQELEAEKKGKISSVSEKPKGA